MAKLTLVSSRPFHGHTGRSFKLTIGDLSGSVHAFATKKRFYAIVSLSTKKDEELEEKFLSSFVLPERQIEQPKVDVSGANANTAANEKVLPDTPNAQQQQNQQTESDPNQAPGTENRADPNAATPQQNPGQQNQGEKKKGPVNGGMLNGRAIYLPVPEAPSSEATGVVLVAIVVDEQGSVMEARAVSGPSALHAAAVSAARFARFSPTLLMGEPVRVSGTLSYNFIKSN